MNFVVSQATAVRVSWVGLGRLGYPRFRRGDGTPWNIFVPLASKNVGWAYAIVPFDSEYRYSRRISRGTQNIYAVRVPLANPNVFAHSTINTP